MPIGIPLSIKLPFRSCTCLSEIWAQLISVFLMFFLSFNTFFKATFRISSNDCSVWEDWERKKRHWKLNTWIWMYQRQPKWFVCNAILQWKLEKGRKRGDRDRHPGNHGYGPGHNHGKLIEKAKSMTGLNVEKQHEILLELAKVFVMSPDGLDAILLTIRYGSRFSPKMPKLWEYLKRFLGLKPRLIWF